MFTKTCPECKKKVEYENEEELHEHFYHKKTHTGNFFLKVCKDCERKKHREKYSDGTYNYRKKDPSPMNENVEVG